jgi:hypothetical protein
MSTPASPNTANARLFFFLLCVPHRSFGERTRALDMLGVVFVGLRCDMSCFLQTLGSVAISVHTRLLVTVVDMVPFLEEIDHGVEQLGPGASKILTKTRMCIALYFRCLNIPHPLLNTSP